jgi:hypothetical protein
VYDYDKPEDPYHKNPLITANYIGTTAYKCARNGIIGDRLGDVRFIDSKVADNKLAGIEVSIVQEVKDDKCQVRNALIIGKSANTEPELEIFSPHGIICPGSENFVVRGAKFFNFDFNNAAALGTCSHCMHPAATDSGTRTSKVRELEFTNTPRRIRYQYPWTDIILDQDGSLTGLGRNTWATFHYPHLDQPECTKNLDVYDGVICDSTV